MSSRKSTWADPLRSWNSANNAGNELWAEPRRRTQRGPVSGSVYNSGMLKATEKIWRNGEFIAWDDAKIHVLSHVVSYGSSVFEGIRCYETASGPAVFRLREHIRRMVDSAKIYRMDDFRFTPSSLQTRCWNW